MLNVWQWSNAQVFSFFFVFVRVTSCLIFLPIFGDRVVPGKLKILFGLALSVVVFPLAWQRGVRIDPTIFGSVWHIMWAVAGEVFFGMMVGFVARWIFDAVQFAGSFAGLSIGFSIASVFNPTGDGQTIALAQLEYIMAALLFLSMDGHHIYIRAILYSFKAAQLGHICFLAHGQKIMAYLISMTDEVLRLAVKLSAPVVVVILLLNLTFGVMARAVPQMNVLAVSFTANIFVGLLVVLISLPGFVNAVNGAFSVYTPELAKFMRLFGG